MSVEHTSQALYVLLSLRVVLQWRMQTLEKSRAGMLSQEEALRRRDANAAAMENMKRLAGKQ